MTTTRPTPDHIEPGEITALRALGAQLMAEAQAANSGRASRTVTALPGLRATLLALAAGHELAEHQAPGAATLTCLHGQATLATNDRQWQLHDDDTVAIPDHRHRLTADTDALVLLTVRLD